MRAGSKVFPKVAAIIAVALAFALSPSAASPSAASAGTPNYGWQLYRATNESRIHHGVSRVDRAHRMSRIAERHSYAMARDERLWHTHGPVRYDARCYSWGENVGWTTGDVPDLQKAFMGSAGHRAHILDRGFDRVAVGAAMVNGRLWVTVFFCT